MVYVPEPYEQLGRNFAGGLDRDDRRVVERRGEPRLPQEALPEADVARELRRQQLQRDVALERKLVRAIDDAHASASEQRVDAVSGELGSDGVLLGHCASLMG